MKLQVMPERWRNEGEWETGIFVRAQDPHGKWISADIAILTPDSLLSYLRHCGEHNHLAENVVGILLGHGHIASQVIGTEKGENDG
jgi:hypothetical protein